MSDVCSPVSRQLLPVEDALHRISSSLEPVHGSEQITLKSALHRVLAEPLHAPADIPGFSNASMDGYACRCEKDQPFQRRLVGASLAGHPYRKDLRPGECIRIFTGAMLPGEADCVAMQEHVEVDGDIVHFPGNFQPGQNIRLPGEDIARGQLLLQPPKKLSAMDLGLLASAGICHVRVKRPLKIAFLSTGDELTALGQPLGPGRIYDSNRYTLGGLLAEYAAADLGVVGDDKDSLRQCIVDAAGNYDVLITTGGASVGDADYIAEILGEIGQVDFWKIAMKPGKPLAYGKIGQCCFFGLPGNPASVIATFHQFVAPALDLLSGAGKTRPLRFKVRCSSALQKAPGRQEFQRGILTRHDDGELTVTSAGKQGSHILSAVSRANCYIVLADDCTGTEKGEWVVVEPFSTRLQEAEK